MIPVLTALEYANKLPRFRYRNLTQRMPTRGPFVPQFAIKIATRKQVNAALRMNKRGQSVKPKIMWIDIDAIRSEQMSLSIARLRYHIHHYASIQKQSDGYPGVYMVEGVPVLWDGNHRVTAGKLLGKKKIRCACYSA
jgi:hypothetical protein